MAAIDHQMREPSWSQLPHPYTLFRPSSLPSLFWTSSFRIKFVFAIVIGIALVCVDQISPLNFYHSTRHLSMMPDKITTLETKIVGICQKHKAGNWRKRGYRACVFVEPCYIVKYGDPKTLVPEIATQEYIFGCAKSQSDTSHVPRIPEIKHYFQEGRTMYLVMERITLMVPPPSDLTERVARALKWLSEVKPPPGHVIGPLGGGHIRHKVFKDFKAPLPFSSVDALGRYLETVYKMLPLPPQIKNKVSPVTIRKDRLMFTQSDMDPSNFGVDEQDQTVLTDFEEIGRLPETFVAYTMSRRDGSLDPIASSLGLSNGSNASMAKIRGYLGMVSDPKFGLNEDGYPNNGGQQKTRDRDNLRHLYSL